MLLRLSRIRNGRRILPPCGGLTRLTIATWVQTLFSAFHGYFSAFRRRTTTLSDSIQYLELGLDATRVLAPNPRNHTLDTRYQLSRLLLRGCHSVMRFFPEDFGYAG